MAERLHIFADGNVSFDGFVEEVGELLGAAFLLISSQGGDGRYFYELTTDTVRIEIRADHDLESYADLGLEHFLFWIRIVGVGADPDWRKSRDDFGRALFAKLKSTNRYRLLLVFDLESKWDEFCPFPEPPLHTYPSRATSFDLFVDATFSFDEFALEVQRILGIHVKKIIPRNSETVTEFEDGEGHVVEQRRVIQEEFFEGGDGAVELSLIQNHDLGTGTDAEYLSTYRFLVSVSGVSPDWSKRAAYRDEAVQELFSAFKNTQCCRLLLMRNIYSKLADYDPRQLDANAV